MADRRHQILDSALLRFVLDADDPVVRDAVLVLRASCAKLDTYDLLTSHPCQDSEHEETGVTQQYNLGILVRGSPSPCHARRATHQRDRAAARHANTASVERVAESMASCRTGEPPSQSSQPRRQLTTLAKVEKQGGPRAGRQSGKEAQRLASYGRESQPSLGRPSSAHARSSTDGSAAPA